MVESLKNVGMNSIAVVKMAARKFHIENFSARDLNGRGDRVSPMKKDPEGKTGLAVLASTYMYVRQGMEAE